jgi:uncharacterized protein YehS (DUF1456 family)
MTDWNRHYKRVRGALRLTYPEVVDVCRLGGLEITRSRAEGWNRGEDDVRRFVKMTEAEFDAFTRGLMDWSRENMETST